MTMMTSSFGIKRLAFRLPDFTRYTWVSDLARNVWQPRIARIIVAWQEIEWLAVAAGLVMANFLAAYRGKRRTQGVGEKSGPL